MLGFKWQDADVDLHAVCVLMDAQQRQVAMVDEVKSRSESGAVTFMKDAPYAAVCGLLSLFSCTLLRNADDDLRQLIMVELPLVPENVVTLAFALNVDAQASRGVLKR